MINRQNFSFLINENKIPISVNLKKLISKNKLDMIKTVTNGDDYQILFKITKIGKIISGKKKSFIIDKKGKQIRVINEAYAHEF